MDQLSKLTDMSVKHLHCRFSLYIAFSHTLGYTENVSVPASAPCRAFLNTCSSSVLMSSHLEEQEAFSAAAALDTHKALVHIFFAQRSTKKVKGVTDAGLKPRKVRKVAVLGGGLMGSGIATAGLLAGQQVLIKEVNEKFMEVGQHMCSV